MKFYRGSAAAARSYVEADHSRADDYYLGEGAGVATRFVVDVRDSVSLTVRQMPDLDGDTYERWVGGYDVDTGAAKGRLRDDANALRFVEVTVNGPKTWSLAAALYPEISAALDAAQDQAAAQIIGWVGAHATTRVGPRGRQVQVPVEQIEAAVIRHHTSRAGDPHRHLHLQINARVFAKGGWRGIHSVGARDSLEAINGIGHAAVATNPGFRAALAAHGFTLDPATGEIIELTPYAGKFSARAAQIGRNVEAYEATWRAAHPGQEPGPQLRRTWDRRAWSQARPDKVIPTDGAAMVETWNEELHDLGYRDPNRRVPLASPSAGGLDRDRAVEVVLSRLGAKRSAWNAADIRGQVEQWTAATGLVAEASVRIELAEDLTARALAACTPLLDRPDVPEHIRALSSARVIGVEDKITELLGMLAYVKGQGAVLDPQQSGGLDPAQQNAVAALAGTKHLLVIEGAAGAGKTTTLTATKSALASQGRRLMVVTPTLKAAEVAAAEINAPAFTAAWLVHQWGWRWDDDGHWTQEFQVPTDPAARLEQGDLLVIDEAGMLDQDTARALLDIALEAQVRVAFMGDRHQLPAVGRGGVLDLATQHTGAEATVCLDVVHRFADPTYADLSVAMRRGEPVFDELWEDGHIVLHASEAERTQAIAAQAAEAILAGHTSRALMADTREEVTALNATIRDRLVAAGVVDDDIVVTTSAGERLGVGDRVATRRNDWHYGLANRQRWTITAITPAPPAAGYILQTSKDDGPALELTLRNDHGITRQVPSWYARAWVESAYATTVYGAQGETTAVGHLVLGQGTTAASAYVGMTRGRHENTAHLIAETPAQARTMWEGACSRERADLGVAHARLQALDDIDRYGPIGHPSVKRIPRQPETTRTLASDPAYDTSPDRSRSYSRSGPSIGF